jgi:hypothetical protein
MTTEMETTMDSVLSTYGAYAPTQFDVPGLALDEQQNWLVAPVTQTRDSDCLEESNFAAMLSSLGGESDTVEVHRFGHWGPGWYEIIIISPLDTARVEIAEQTYHTLRHGCAVLDETDFSEREYEAYLKGWSEYECHDFISTLRDKFKLSYDTTDAMRDIDQDTVREWFESLIPSGEISTENHSMVRYAVDRCRRPALARFLRENRPRTHRAA